MRRPIGDLDLTATPLEGVPLPKLRQNLKDDVASYIRALIYSGTMYPGARVDQNAIARHLGLSRLPVREALITLENEGTIEILPRRGAYVASLTRRDIRDAYDVYGAVAALAARQAATSIDAAALEELDALITAMSKPGLTVDDHSALNHAFHRTINIAGTTRRLQASLRTLARGIPRWPSSDPGWVAPAIAHHRAIVDALEARDVEAAAAAMHEHLLAGADYVIDQLEQHGFWQSRDGSGEA